MKVLYKNAEPDPLNQTIFGGNLEQDLIASQVEEEAEEKRI